MALNDCNLWDTPSGKFEGHASRWVNWLRDRADTLVLIQWIKEHAPKLAEGLDEETDLETRVNWIIEHVEEIIDAIKEVQADE